MKMKIQNKQNNCHIILKKKTTYFRLNNCNDHNKLMNISYLMENSFNDNLGIIKEQNNYNPKITESAVFDLKDPTKYDKKLNPNDKLHNYSLIEKNKVNKESNQHEKSNEIIETNNNFSICKEKDPFSKIIEKFKNLLKEHKDDKNKIDYAFNIFEIL